MTVSTYLSHLERIRQDIATVIEKAKENLPPELKRSLKCAGLTGNLWEWQQMIRQHHGTVPECSFLEELTYAKMEIEYAITWLRQYGRTPNLKLARSRHVEE